MIDALETRISEMVCAANACSKKGLAVPGILLMYATIDFLSGLVCKTEEQSNKDAFTQWVDTFLLPGSQLPCTALELYAARCGLIHSLSAEARLTNQGIARELYYAVGPAQAAILQIRLKEVGAKDFLVLDLKRFANALQEAVERFLLHLRENPSLNKKVRERVQAKTLVPVNKPRSGWRAAFLRLFKILRHRVSAR